LVTNLTGKTRPAVFVRFVGDYLVVRGIFAAGKYEERERQSPRLIDPKRALKKKSVVGVHEQELDVAAVKRKIGRLEPADLARLGLHDDPTGAMAQSDSRAERIARNLLETGAVTNSTVYSEFLVCVIREMRRDAELEVELRSAGVFLSEVGAVVASLCRELNVERETGFSRKVRAVLADNPDIGLVLIDDQLGAERLVFVEPAGGQTLRDTKSGEVPDPTGRTEETVVEIPVNWRPLDYEPPSLIIFDQLWLWQALDGRRLDFDVIAESLREGGNGKILWVGPAVTVGLASLHTAIRARGWTVVGAEDRDGDIDLAVAGAREFADRPITVVSGGADLLDAIESVAERVSIIEEIRPFLQ
jgi:protein-tyrosine-phosphatase